MKPLFLSFTAVLLLIFVETVQLEGDWIVNNTLTKKKAQQNTSYVKKCETDTDCLPWTECNNTECVCRDSLEKLTTAKCDMVTLQLSVLSCHCVTFQNKTNEVFVGYCIENCQNNYVKSEYLPLPLNVSTLNQFMCEKSWNRTGKLCGSCLPGHSPLAYSYDLRCVSCPEGIRNIWKYVLAAFGLSTLFYFIVLIFKLKATSLLLHGYISYCQIISIQVLAIVTTQALRDHPDVKSLAQITGAIYTMWNLDFLRGLYPDICLNVSTLTVFAMDYAVAIYPLLLTTISYMLIELYARNVKIIVMLWKPIHYILVRCKRNWNMSSRTTVIDAFATFCYLSFIKLLVVSTCLLVPVKVTTLNNELNTTWMVYFDANIPYFGPEHIPYAVAALVCCAVIFIFISSLLLFQFQWFQRLLSCLKLEHQLLKDVMESFQSCYKNGTEPGTKDYRWFAAVPLIAGCLLLTTFALTPGAGFPPYAVPIIITKVILTVIVQPHKNTNYTKLEVFFWGLLAVSFCLFEGTNYPSLRPVSQRRTAGILIFIVPLIPLVYIICVTVYWTLSRVRIVHTLISRIQAWRKGYSDIEQTWPDRILNPDQYIESRQNLYNVCE